MAGAPKTAAKLFKNLYARSVRIENDLLAAIPGWAQNPKNERFVNAREYLEASTSARAFVDRLHDLLRALEIKAGVASSDEQREVDEFDEMLSELEDEEPPEGAEP